jgi:hypothetical protein
MAAALRFRAVVSALADIMSGKVLQTERAT